MMSTIAAVLLGSVVPLGTVTAGPRPQTAPSSRTAPVISYMDVEIWPEYDKPSVLLIYKGTLAAPVKVPAEFTFVIPPDVEMNMVGGVDSAGRHIHAPYQTRTRSDGLVEVQYRLTVPNFYMEFYYNPLKGEAQRRFTYTVVSPFSVDTLAIAVQEPRRVQDFTITPVSNRLSQDQNGFNYRILQYDSVAAGTRTPVTVAYRKADDRPSVAAAGATGAPAPSGTTDAPAPSSRGRTAILILALIAIGAAGFGLYPLVRGWLEARRGAAAATPGSAAADAARPGTESAIATPRARDRAPESIRPRFCTECGAPLAPEGSFCGMCGTRVRLSEQRRTDAATG